MPTSPPLTDCLHELLHSSKHLVINLTGGSFMDSQGLSPIVNADEAPAPAPPGNRVPPETISAPAALDPVRAEFLPPPRPSTARSPRLNAA